MSAALQDGFTVLPAIFTQEEIASLRQALADNIDRVARAMLTPFAAHPSLTESLVTLPAPEVPTGHMIRTRAAIPAFRARISPWHQDVPQPQSATGCATVRVACWIPLSDVDENSGALEVLPGASDAPCRHDAGDDGHFGILRGRCRTSNRASCRCDRATCCSSIGSSPTARGRRVGCKDAGPW